MQDHYSNKYISILYRYGQRFFVQKLSEYNIDVGEHPFLLNIHKTPGVNQDKLSELLSIDKATTARMIKSLEEKDFIYRECDKKDRRVNHLYPTDKANDLIPEIRNVISELHGVLYENLTKEEVNVMYETLVKMTDNLIQYMKGNNSK